jgi:outer membrane protein assembly factor BamE (lipoprotein component of BamABCDE complex)
MKRTLTALFIAASLSLAGCVTIGKTFPVEQISHIQAGVTTRADIEKMFGQPWRVGKDAGLRTWTYAHYKYALFGDSKTRDLVIRFDETGKVVNFTFNSTYREDEKL